MMVFNKTNFRLYILAAVCAVSTIFAAALIYFILCAGHEVNAGFSNHSPAMSLPENTLGESRFIKYKDNNNEPLCELSFKKLSVENNDLGIFKSALHNKLSISGLELTIYQYAAERGKSLKKNKTSAVPKKSSETEFSDLIDCIKNFSDISWFGKLDIEQGNVSEVFVDRFRYNLVKNGSPFLSVESGRASASYKTQAVILRGHTKIIAENNCLEANHVEWNLKEKTFRVIGGYILNSSGTITTGKNICVDARLNIKQTDSKEKKCFARSN